MVLNQNMGNNSSLPKGRRKSLRSSSRKLRRNSSLSHAFNIIEHESKIELMNINFATEEELMTLPGVNREIAKNIVDHRKAIGRFRKIEDLALVHGVGATKLELIKPEICVLPKANHSSSSIRAPSYDSLRSNDSRLTIKSNKLININKATIFEIQGIHGIDQELAAAIIVYRTKKGPFKQIEDLLKIKNINRVRLDNISRYLTVDDTDYEVDENNGPTIIPNGLSKALTNGNNKGNGGPFSLPISNGLSMSCTTDIFELLSAYSPRPILEETFRNKRNGELAFRLASWNLHEFTNEKVLNFGVKEVICRTILENGFSIIAVQDVLSASALESICDELNKPKLRRIKDWSRKNQNWNYCMLDVHNSKLGFIYNTQRVVDIELLSINEGPQQTRDACDVMVATFQVGSMHLQLINMVVNDIDNMELIQEKFKELLIEEELIVLFVDFTNIEISSDKFLTIDGLKPVFPVTTNTTYVPLKPDSNKHKSNILINKKLINYETSHSGVIRLGLTHLAIPNGWSWGGPASPFCPLWTELFLRCNTDTAL